MRRKRKEDKNRSQEEEKIRIMKEIFLFVSKNIIIFGLIVFRLFFLILSLFHEFL
jgi:hypothetical protein